jgi:hypothetical protein
MDTSPGVLQVHLTNEALRQEWRRLIAPSKPENTPPTVILLGPAAFRKIDRECRSTTGRGMMDLLGEGSSGRVQVVEVARPEMPMNAAVVGQMWQDGTIDVDFLSWTGKRFDHNSQFYLEWIESNLRGLARKIPGYLVESAGYAVPGHA